MNSPDRYIALINDLAENPAELPWVEFKLNNHEPDRIGTLISAISNAARAADQPCGYVIWGVEDQTHRVLGTTFRPIAEKAHHQPLELWLHQQISPSLHSRALST
jgi:ATP-dependent DNA helicase RecG